MHPAVIAVSVFMADLLLILLVVFGAPIVAAVGSIALLDRLAPQSNPKYWPLLAAWWFPLFLLAYVIHVILSRDCPPYDECGGLGAALWDLFGFASILTGLLIGPFAARLTLRYLRRS